jgi:NADH:ubiquinone oxidoreductase subunit 3 (subunit A)
MFLYPSTELFLSYLVIVATISLVLLTLPAGLSPSRAFSIEKLSAYECGFEPFRTSKEAVEHHFIVVAILFVIFDLELIFLFP